MVAVSDCVDLMRVAIGRRNVSDPDSTDNVLLGYVSDFMKYTMTDDIKIVDQFETFNFEVEVTLTEHTDGVWLFNEIVIWENYSNLEISALISLNNTPSSSLSWQQLQVTQVPSEFWATYGFNNEDVLIRGFPTVMLLDSYRIVLRAIPEDNTPYLIQMYGYTINPAVALNGTLPRDYWKRYVAYGAALNYAMDFHFTAERLALLKDSFAHERKLILSRTFNQLKHNRCIPRF